MRVLHKVLHRRCHEKEDVGSAALILYLFKRSESRVYAFSNGRKKDLNNVGLFAEPLNRDRS